LRALEGGNNELGDSTVSEFTTRLPAKIITDMRNAPGVRMCMNAVFVPKGGIAQGGELFMYPLSVNLTHGKANIFDFVKTFDIQ
jgi:hypothetical protein